MGFLRRAGTHNRVLSLIYFTVEAHFVFADFTFTKPFESSLRNCGIIPLLELFLLLSA